MAIKVLVQKTSLFLFCLLLPLKVLADNEERSLIVYKSPAKISKIDYVNNNTEILAVRSEKKLQRIVLSRGNNNELVQISPNKISNIKEIPVQNARFIGIRGGEYDRSNFSDAESNFELNDYEFANWQNQNVQQDNRSNTEKYYRILKKVACISHTYSIYLFEKIMYLLEKIRHLMLTIRRFKDDYNSQIWELINLAFAIFMTYRIITHPVVYIELEPLTFKGLPQIYKPQVYKPEVYKDVIARDVDLLTPKDISDIYKDVTGRDIDPLTLKDISDIYKKNR